jgi:oxalate decarboxylase
MAAYLLRFKQGAVYEPHWHPNAAELDYVIEGRARMTILSPGGSVDTFEVNSGQIVFIPAAYFHYIENPDSINNMHFAVFFGHEKPEDIVFQEHLVHILMRYWLLSLTWILLSLISFLN